MTAGNAIDRLDDTVPVSMDRGRVWNAASFLAAVTAGIATRKLLTRIWTTATGEQPPTNPAERSTGWREALLWGGTLGAAVGIGRLVARRGMASAWTHVLDEDPPIA